MSTFTVGLTGPTGAGKSTAALAARDNGFAVIDADITARQATEKGSPLLEILCRQFGDVLNPDGTLDRKQLAARAFCDRESTEKLNGIMLPYIKSLITAQIDALKKEGKSLILLDAPTLFEAGADDICDTVIGVLAPLENRLQRIISRDNMTKGAALMRINAGKNDEYYKQRCAYILVNDGDISHFYDDCDKLFKALI